MLRKTTKAICGFVLLGGALYSCNPGLDVEPQQAFDALPQTVLSPADNPSTPEKVALGKLLFYDPVLSGNRDVSCASCHHPDFGYADGLDLAIGVDGEGLGPGRHFIAGSSMPPVKRNTPTLLNVAFNGMDAAGIYDPAAAPMFADSRVRSLEAQSLHPIAALEEMRGPRVSAAAILDTVVARVQAIGGYAALFEKAFGTRTVTAQAIAKALAAYERSLTAVNAPFDRYARGEKGAMSDAQKRGLALFIQNGCNDCHAGPMFSDYKLHVLGVPDNSRLPATDAGADGTYAFRTPTLRNLRFTAPYMHSGTLATLDDVLTFYDGVSDGTGRNPHVSGASLDTALRTRVTLNQDLIDFLDALSDDALDKSVPANVPSGLPVGGNIR